MSAPDTRTKLKFKITVQVGSEKRVIHAHGETQKRAVNYAQRLCTTKWNMDKTDFHTNLISVEPCESGLKFSNLTVLKKSTKRPE